ncbi:hypothetical protein [Streptomyces sp. NPDC101145]|uniref:hypothetical protein n=1 Tax=Streptomyces sp. NPDC101145 TaxID=3366112 RepID=UPI00380A9660
MGIIHAFLHRVLGFLLPASGQRRCGPGVVVVAAQPERAAAPPPLPLHRSPYGADGLIDGAATPLVRPYLAAYEARHRQAWRRTALVLAADFGIDLDDRDLHGAGALG